MKQIRMYTNLAFIVLLFSLSPFVFAATIHVPAEQPTIQSGIDIARNGDTVLVDDGVYTGEGNVNLDFKGKRITLKSKNGADATIIDCEKKLETRGFIFENDETIDSMLAGFTIKNGVHIYGGGVYLSYASPTIRNCVIDRNEARKNGSWTGFGGGIYIFNADPTITDCTIIRNEAESIYGGGICIDGEFFRDGVVLRETQATPTIQNCTITDNSGVGIYAQSFVNPIINECIISNNSGRGILYNVMARTNNPITNCRIEQNRGGLGVSEYSVMVAKDSIIIGNTATTGGGLSCSPTSVLRVSDCVIAHNTATVRGGGIEASKKFGGVNIKHCTITQNTAGGKGGGVYADMLGCPFNLTDSIVWGNFSDGTHAEVFASGVSITIKSCDIGKGLEGIGQVADGEDFIYEDNIDADPLFVDADSENFRLKPDSPAAGMGVRERAFQTGPFAVSQHGKRLVKRADLKRR